VSWGLWGLDEKTAAPLKKVVKKGPSVRVRQQPVKSTPSMPVPPKEKPIGYNEDDIPDDASVLYRGVLLNLNNPGLEKVRDILHQTGDYKHPELGSHLMDYMESGADRNDEGVEHWSVDPFVAENFAGNPSRGDHQHIPMLMKAHWYGQGGHQQFADDHIDWEEGKWGSEMEVPLQVGAPLHMQKIVLRHPDTHDWHHVLRAPRHTTAAIDRDVADDLMRLAMPNPLPQGVHFRYHPELQWSPGVTAHYNGKMIGSLEWFDDDHIMVDLGSRKPGEIDRISVDPKHQGNSVASSMFDFAKQHEPRLHHSDQLTDDGRGWSEYEKSRNARLAMAWDEWAPKIKSDNGGCGSGECDYFEGVGTKWAGYFIDDDKNNPVGSLSFSHYTENNKPHIGIRGIYTDKNYRNDGVAEALMRRLHEDHPGISIDPGGMSSDGQAFHDRMLDKEPDARGIVISSIVRRDGEDDVVDCPSCRTESLTDDYNHGGHCPVCGQFNWEYNEHRHGSLRIAGLHGDLPENITFQHHPAGFEPFPDVIQPNVPVSSSYPTVSAHDGDRMIGHIQWRDDGHPRRDNEIWDLRVHPDYQRRGVATALFDWTTDKINPDLKHSNNLSDEGRAFAEAEDRRPLAEERYEAWRNGQPMPKRFAGRNGDPPPMTFEPFNTMWSNGIMARHAEDGRPIAHLHWHPDGEIETIRVHPELQGRDIAKHILAHAATHPDTYEARQGIKPSNNLTNAGRAFARSLGHDPSDEEVEPADDDVTNWGWTAVDNYTPMHIPYTGQNEDEMNHHLDKPWTPPERTAASHSDSWPAWWRGRNHPNVPWDKRWNPNHPQHTPAPWDN